MTPRIPLAAAALAAFSVPALAQQGTPAQGEGGRPYTVQMTGAAERPGPGDPDGAGTATFRVNAGQNRVCYTLSVSNIDPATAAHIHRGGPDSAGPPVVTLDAPADGSSEACADVARALAQELIRTPAAFYVNVHNAAFPAGAVRGQLGR
ncbi:MAG: CHRD domain-containing protein [Sphingosinicella sp.]|uniref:CHRD domain-containing protein n=1 Tax=Sphingosinicella sp. TaxID=1917971 RepID=UPI004037CE51